MEFYSEVQHWLERKNVVADCVSRLQSNHMDESYLDEGIQECYVDQVEGIISVDTVKSS